MLVLDVNTRSAESSEWTINPELPVDLSHTVRLRGFLASGEPAPEDNAKRETHEDYQVMRSAIRLGSLSAYLVGALIVFFTFRVIVEQRKREIALLRSLGTTTRQVASIFLLEASLVGVTGAAAGLAGALPLARFAARLGITTTGRSTIDWVWFPWPMMILVSVLGALTAILGVLRPLADVLRLDVPKTLRPQFLEGPTPAASRRRGSRSAGELVGGTGAVTPGPGAVGWVRTGPAGAGELAGGAGTVPPGAGAVAPARTGPERASRVSFRPILLPFIVLFYLMVRPFFAEILPSLTFFILESILVAAGFLGALIFVPELVRVFGRVAARLLPPRPLAPRLLTARRLERMGHELAWAVSGVTLVFAMLLSLHILTRALKSEVKAWAAAAVRGRAFLYSTRRGELVPEDLLRGIPPEVVIARFSSRSPWPNPLMAVDPEDLVRFAKGVDPESEAIAARLGPGKILLSTMMARRFGLEVGSFLEVESESRKARLEVIGITDRIGYVPAIGPYRNSKTYGVISSADLDLIARYAGPIGAGIVMRWPLQGWGAASGLEPNWWRLLAPAKHRPGVAHEIGRDFEQYRLQETDKDFVIFDLILLLTGVLAAIGIANNLVLSAHARRRELALYRVLGMEVGQIRALFLMEGAFIGSVGGLLAVALGIPLGYLGLAALRVISAFTVRFELPWTYVAVTVGGALLVSLVSALYPASRVARYSAAESVHYE